MLLKGMISTVYAEMFVIQALVGVFLTKKKKRWRGFLVPRFSKFPSCSARRSEERFCLNRPGDNYQKLKPYYCTYFEREKICLYLEILVLPGNMYFKRNQLCAQLINN